MARYIDADTLKNDGRLCWNDDRGNTYYEIDHAPTADVVSQKAYEQVKWERDTAIEQLKSYGVGFCENADVVKVIRCKDCIYSTTIKDNDSLKNYVWCYLHSDRLILKENYCGFAIRRDDND